ncbi:MAG: winged helix-turn-helix transcriptional regulator [Planctomycetes bacterium]|nr:winged helix-turn-helix transcriptional regulator [Planctomycetota bacterium]
MHNAIEVSRISRSLKALCDVNRIRLLEILSTGEHCVSDLVDRLAIDQPKVSHHLAILRAAGIVRSRRDGRHINYSLRPLVHRRVESAEGVTDAFDLGEISVTFHFGREAAGLPAPQRQLAHAAGVATQTME